MHPNSHHSATECRGIIKLAKRVSEWRQQTSKDGSPPRCRPGKERVDDGDVAAGERDLGYQSPEQVLKDILTGGSDSGDDTDRHKKLYVIYGGSWELTSRRNVKSLPRGPFGDPRVPEGSPTPAVAEHHYLLRGIRLPREHGRVRHTAAHHRPYHC
jgi:hypothetical protein